LQKHPEHEEGIRLLAARDPSGNLKYLDWGTRMLVAKQALAPEIADIVELFHRFNGRHLNRGRGHERRPNFIRTDIYTYRPQDLARLRDSLLKLQRATDRKRRERERLYRIEGAVEADVVYDSDDLIVRHIKNKQASVHYGHNTKWCIAMNREGYFEDYEARNAAFFFFERKTPVNDEFDKVALMVLRDGERSGTAEAFTTLDSNVDMMGLAKVYGPRVFDIFRAIYEHSARHPASIMFQVHAGLASQEQLEAVFARIVKREFSPHETRSTLIAICCNDNAPPTLLEEIGRGGSELLAASCKKHRSVRMRRHRTEFAAEAVRRVMAAIVIHPNTPEDVRETLSKGLRRRRVALHSIRRTIRYGQVGVDVGDPRRRLRRHHRRENTVKRLLARAEIFERIAARKRKKAQKLAAKLEAKKFRLEAKKSNPSPSKKRR
jgi:hypothetical protein